MCHWEKMGLTKDFTSCDPLMKVYKRGPYMVQWEGTIKWHPLLKDCWVTGFPRPNSLCSQWKPELCYHKVWATREEMVALIRVSEDWVYGRLAQLLRAWIEAGYNRSGENRMWRLIYFIESRKQRVHNKRAQGKTITPKTHLNHFLQPGCSPQSPTHIATPSID